MDVKLKLCAKYKIDLHALSDQGSANGKRKPEKDPIGATQEYVGTLDDIKKKICADLDKIYKDIEDLYWAND